MVQVIHVVRTADDIGYPGYSPLIHIHHVERSVFGNGIAIHIYGEMRIAAKEVVYARELMLNTIQTLTLTPETGTHTPYHAQKYRIIIPSDTWLRSTSTQRASSTTTAASTSTPTTVLGREPELAPMKVRSGSTSRHWASSRCRNPVKKIKWEKCNGKIRRMERLATRGLLH